MVLTGQFDHSIDDKGRVSVPVRFREALERDQVDSLFITNSLINQERCLELYTPAEWQRFINKIKERNRFEANLQRFQTFYIGGAHEVQFDNQGRVLIPPKLREFARLGREVTFAAAIDCFQLWNRELFTRVFADAEEAIRDPEFFAKLNL